MPSSCAVIGCRNRYGEKNSSITLHKFPQDAAISAKWTAATRRKNWKPTFHSKLCSAHFANDAFRRYNERTYLKENAVPVIVPNNYDNARHLRGAETSDHYSDHTYTTIVHDEVDLGEETDVNEDANQDSPELVVKEKDDFKYVWFLNTGQIQQQCFIIESDKQSHDNVVSQPPAIKQPVKPTIALGCHNYCSPGNDRLLEKLDISKKTCNKLRQQLKFCKQKLRRQRKMITYLREKVKDVNSRRIEQLKKSEQEKKELLKQQALLQDVKPKPKRKKKIADDNFSQVILV